MSPPRLTVGLSAVFPVSYLPHTEQIHRRIHTFRLCMNICCMFTERRCLVRLVSTGDFSINCSLRLQLQPSSEGSLLCVNCAPVANKILFFLWLRPFMKSPQSFILRKTRMSSCDMSQCGDFPSVCTTDDYLLNDFWLFSWNWNIVMVT